MISRGLKVPPPTNRQFGAYVHDPVPFFHTVLKADPWDLQQRIARTVANHRRVAVRSCHHSGKTYVAGGLVPWFLAAFEPSLCITTAPTERQVKDELWNEIAQHYRRSGLPGKLNKLSLEISPTQRAFGFTTNEPERFQGWHCPNILVIVDEASGVDEQIYQAIEGCLTGPNSHLLLLGNPNSPQGTFYEAFRSSLYQTFHISAADVPGHLLPEHWMEERLQEWGEDNPAYQVRVLGNFPDQGTDSLIRMSWVTDAQQRELSPGEPIEIGVDIAYMGDDESVAYVRCGAKVVDADYWRGNDTMQSAGHVARLADKWRPGSIKVDSVGYGAGTLDRLVEEGYPAIGVNVGETAMDSERFNNRRSEIFWGLADRLKAGDIDIPDADSVLLSQLTALKYDYSPRGQIRLESKADMKKRRGTSVGWSSPDRGDALALAFAVAGPRWLPGAWTGEAREAWT